MTASKPVFRAPGWELADDREARSARRVVSDLSDTNKAVNADRAMRRAAAQLRDIALSTPFRWFVTLTISPEKLDRYDDASVLKRFGIWCQNAVQRHGIGYAVVPERHKDGALHFHGFITEGLDLIDSGTISIPGKKSPIRPKSDEKRLEMLQNGGKIVYNVPGWSWGFSTAIELSGRYEAAVSYVCKYVRKQQEKIGGRWFYRGGVLNRPLISYPDVTYRDHEEADPEAYQFRVAGTSFQITRVCDTSAVDVEKPGFCPGEN